MVFLRLLAKMNQEDILWISIYLVSRTKEASLEGKPATIEDTFSP
jgi:hypothetical protein